MDEWVGRRLDDGYSEWVMDDGWNDDEGMMDG